MLKYTYSWVQKFISSDLLNEINLEQIFILYYTGC